VLKRTVENSVLAFLVERARRAGGSDITARAMETRRNGPAREFVESRGFERTPGSENLVYRLPAGTPVPYSEWVTIAASAALVPGAAR
jgi:predicted enzyme involved in methoxymalonyl-ACP biosynthesis